jgi:hypothetical protein|tara:strand:+ start:7890 stop:8993 length:1104 start_codon:yes stop_codon:yes gene_type:complete
MARRNIKFRDRRDKGRLNNLIEKRLNDRMSKPLIKNPKRPLEEATKISKIIKEPEVLVKTGKPLEDNIVITKEDKVSEAELINLVKPLPTNDGNVNSIVSAILNPKTTEIKVDPILDTKDFNEEDKRRIFAEEKERRAIEDERFRKIQEAFEDEKERRIAFKKELEQMKIEFYLYLKEKYPDIVGEKNIKDKDIEKKKEEAIRLAEEIRIKKEKLKQNMVIRLEEEKIRKQKEIRMVTNTKTEANVSTFLEEEIIIEQQEKKDRNPELDGLNEVERTIKEVKAMEIRLGRPIIPHRDIVESEDSDFDSERATKSTDILIKPSQKSPFENYEEKRDVLEVLRQTLSNNKSEEDFIVKMDKQDRKSRRR